MKPCLYVFVGFWLLVATSVWACNTPVFRYALVYWPPDSYEVVVIHRGPLNAEGQDLLKKLQETSDRSSANILVKTVDTMRAPDSEMVKLREGRSPSELPWLVVRYPELLQIREPVWDGPFTAAMVEELLHSPVRAEVVRRILTGESAVWILVESGVKERDEAAVQRLEAQLKRMEETLKLPVLEDDRGGYVDVTNVDLKVAFSMIRVARTNPREQLLIQNLLPITSDSEEALQPAAFPIFGRGRALCVLIGDDIDAWNIEDICSFLIGRCSCQVKQLNPGMDLLISTEWDRMLATRMSVYAQASLSENPSESATTKDNSPGMLRRNLLLVVFLQLAAVVIATSVVMWQKKRRGRG